MNFIKGIIGKRTDAELESQSQSVSEEEKPKQSAAADTTTAVPDAAPVDPCTGCADPCDLHPTYPSYLKIDQGDMTVSFKPHRRHVLVAQGRRFNEWIDEVTDEPYHFLHTMHASIERAQSQIHYGVRVGAVDLERLQAEELTAEESEQIADLYLFPDQLVFPRVSISAIDDWVRAIFIEDRGRFQMNESDEQRHRERERAITRAHRPVSEDHGSEHLDLEFEHQSIDCLSLLICAHKKRDKRCGITGPILEREFTARAAALQHLHSGTGYTTIRTFLVSHIGGHKFAGNVIIYPPGLWLGRVKPCHVDTILDAYARVDSSAGESEAARKQLQILKRGEIEW